MFEKFIPDAEGKKLNVLGDNQLIKLTGLDTNGQLTILTQDNPHNTQIPKHVHTNEDEVYQILEGEIAFEIGDQKLTAKKGDTIFLPRDIPHSFTVVGTGNAKTSLTIFPSGLENMFEELSALPAGPPDFPKVAQVCGQYGVHFV